MVEINGLTKRYREVLALDEVSFTVPAGSVTGFLGPNGAGKTTTLRILLGLAAPTSGEALIAGRPYRESARLVGAVLESGDFHPARTARDHLRVLAAAARLPEPRVDEVLAMVELRDARVRTYSLGMRQRLGLAAALLGEPRLLVLDEPANGLDPAGIHWLRGFLRAFADGGGAVLVSSHLLAELAQTADRFLILSRGRLVATVEDLGERALEDLYLEVVA